MDREQFDELKARAGIVKVELARIREERGDERRERLEKGAEFLGGTADESLQLIKANRERMQASLEQARAMLRSDLKKLKDAGGEDAGEGFELSQEAFAGAKETAAAAAGVEPDEAEFTLCQWETGADGMLAELDFTAGGMDCVCYVDQSGQVAGFSQQPHID